jgi:hypothetical protein
MKKGFIVAKWPIIYAACHLGYLHVSQSVLKVLSLTANMSLTRSPEKGIYDDGTSMAVARSDGHNFQSRWCRD